MFDLFKHLKKQATLLAPQAFRRSDSLNPSVQASLDTTVLSPEARILHAVYAMLPEAPLGFDVLTGVPSTEKQVVVVAFSGGLDSSVLLHAVKLLQEGISFAKSASLQEAYRALELPEQGLKHLQVVAAWCDHGWRGTPAPEFPRIHKTCLQGRIPLMVLPLDKSLPHNETKARTARYEALVRLSDQLKAYTVMTAHHQRDQVETLFLRLFRGTGVNGLQGIQPIKTMRNTAGMQAVLRRPFLEVSKQDLMAYQQTEGLYFFEDPSNQDLQHPRNWVRHQLLPLLQERFPEVERHVLRLTQWAQEDMTWLDELLQGQYQHLQRESLTYFQTSSEPTALNTWLQSTSLHTPLALPLLTPLTVGLQKRLLQQWLQPFYPEEAPPTLVEMSQLTEFLAKYDTSKHEAKYKHLPKARYHASIEGASQETSNPIYLRVCRDSISLTTECPKRHRTKIITPQSELCLSVTVPGTFFHAGLKKNLVIRDISNNERKRFTNQGLQSRGFEVMVNLDWWMDIAKQLSEGEAHPWALTLRPRQTGDRFMPLGMPTTVSLKRYLINHKVPVHLRDTLPLLVAGDNQVLWIPGIGISDACRVEEKPTHVLKIVHAEAPIPTHKKVRYQTLAELEALPQGHSTIEGDILKEEDTDGLPLPLRDKVLLDTLEPSSQEEENTALL